MGNSFAMLDGALHLTPYIWRAFWSRNLPVAIYIVTDFERLYPWKQKCAANLYRTLQAMGQRCLNDPARAMTRFELLRAHCRRLPDCRGGTVRANLY